MSDAVTLRLYAGEADAAAERIAAFRLAHSDYVQTREDALGDLRAWTSDGHRFYFLDAEGAAAGFAHLGSRDGEIDWVEELFIRPEYQGHGLGAAALEAIAGLVRGYSESLYLEVAARNLRALRLYRRAGFDCLNTVTLRRDFHPEEFETVRSDELLGHSFDVRRKRAPSSDTESTGGEGNHVVS